MDPHTEAELRLKCLGLAVGAALVDADAVKVANVYTDFVVRGAVVTDATENEPGDA